MIYSKIWASQQVGHLSSDAKILYIGMITLADDDGRLIGNASYLRGQVFPYDEKMEIERIKDLKKEIESAGLIECYVVGDFEYIQHPKWEEYQVIRGDLYKHSSLPSRNGKGTKPLQKRDTSKDKLSKDKEEGEYTPSQKNKEFFDGGNYYQELLNLFSKGKKIDLITNEFQKFLLYWTELNKSGTKQRWEQQSTFDVKRRLFTWLSRAKDFNSNKNTPNYIL